MTDEEWERQYAELKIPTILNIPKEIKTTDYYYSHYEND